MSEVQFFFTDGGATYKCINKKWPNVNHEFVNHNAYFVKEEQVAINYGSRE